MKYESANSQVGCDFDFIQNPLEKSIVVFDNAVFVNVGEFVYTYKVSHNKYVLIQTDIDK